MRESLAQMLQRAIAATNEQLLSVGRLGRVEADGSVTLHVPGTIHQAYVRLGADAMEGVITAFNFGVPWRAHTPCRLLKLARVWIIIGLDYASDQIDAESYNVAPHEHLPRAGLGGAVSLGEPVTVRIQGGKISVPLGTSNVLLLPESGTSDNLDAILGGDEGQLLLLAPAADGDTITVRGYNNALVSEKNIDMRGSGNNRVMADRHDNVLLVWREATGHWEEAGPLTLNQLIGAVDSVNGQTGAVVLDADDIDDTSTTNKWATAADLALIATAVQPGDLAAVAFSGDYNDLDNTPSIPTQYTDEMAQDAVGAILTDSSTVDFTYNDAGNTITATVIQSGLDHGSISGLGDDDHSIYALLAGRSGGQTLKGGTGSGDDLILESTNHATKGEVVIQPNGGRTGFGTSAPDAIVHVRGTNDVTGGIVIESTAGTAADRLAIYALGNLSTAFQLLSAGQINFLTTSGDIIAAYLQTQVLTVGMGTTGGNRLGLKAGNSTNDAAAGGVLYVTTTQAGNVGGGRDTLYSYTVPASTLAVNGQSLWFELSGYFAANSNIKTLTVQLGGISLYERQAGFNGREFSLRGRVFRTGASSIKATATMIISFDGGHTYRRTATLTLSSAQTLTVLGESQQSQTDDVIVDYLAIGWDDNNT